MSLCVRENDNESPNQFFWFLFLFLIGNHHNNDDDDDDDDEEDVAFGTSAHFGSRSYGTAVVRIRTVCTVHTSIVYPRKRYSRYYCTWAVILKLRGVISNILTQSACTNVPEPHPSWRSDRRSMFLAPS
jgi:hypothetical protein